ncbi:ATP-binding protein [Streptomyces puniciscabiei]
MELVLVRHKSRVEHARRIGATWLRNACRAPETQIEAFVQVLSELVTNAVVHGHGDEVDVRLRLVDGEVRLEVDDHSPSAVPEATCADADCEGGRGLWLVAAFVDELHGRWGYAGNGSVAWCAFPLTPLPPYTSRQPHPSNQAPAPGSKREYR